MRTILVLLSIALPAAPGFALPSHCSGNEQVIFSCVVDNGPKLVSLCASPQLNATSGTLYYRFGGPSKIELEYPARPDGAAHRFKHVMYSRADATRKEVTFTIGKTNYRVFDYDEDFDGKRKRYRGVRVTQGSVETERFCTGAVMSKLDSMEGKVPCDTESALGQCDKPALFK